MSYSLQRYLLDEGFEKRLAFLESQWSGTFSSREERSRFRAFVAAEALPSHPSCRQIQDFLRRWEEEREHLTGVNNGEVSRRGPGKLK